MNEKSSPVRTFRFEWPMASVAAPSSFTSKHLWKAVQCRHSLLSNVAIACKEFRSFGQKWCDSASITRPQCVKSDVDDVSTEPANQTCWFDMFQSLWAWLHVHVPNDMSKDPLSIISTSPCLLWFQNGRYIPKRKFWNRLCSGVRWPTPAPPTWWWRRFQKQTESTSSPVGPRKIWF